MADSSQSDKARAARQRSTQVPRQGFQTSASMPYTMTFAGPDAMQFQPPYPMAYGSMPDLEEIDYSNPLSETPYQDALYQADFLHGYAMQYHANMLSQPPLPDHTVHTDATPDIRRRNLQPGMIHDHGSGGETLAHTTSSTTSPEVDQRRVVSETKTGNSSNIGIASQTGSPYLKNIPLEQIPQSSTRGASPQQTHPSTSITAASPIDGVDSRSVTLGDDATADERFEYLLECAENEGFDSLDTFFSNYVTSQLPNGSVAHTEQRLGRNRRLPALIASLREGSKTWTSWERSGYQDEILNSAEGIFTAEMKKFMDHPILKRLAEADVADHVEEENNDQDETTAESADSSDKISLSKLRQTFQDELPELWATLSALIIDQNAVLATMLVLCCSGSLPNEKLQLWLTRCLRNKSSGPDEDVSSR